MELKDYIVNNNFHRVGVVGRAGSGKTTLVKSMELPYFSIDSAFIKSSEFRKELLDSKGKVSIDSYIDGCNMFSWWNWELVDGFLSQESDQTLIIEGAILGPSSVLEKLDKIVFILSDQETRFHRLRERDKAKRNFKESIVRFLVTEYSESLHYKFLMDNYYDKIIFVDNNYVIVSDFGPEDLYDDLEFLPVEISIV